MNKRKSLGTELCRCIKKVRKTVKVRPGQNNSLKGKVLDEVQKGYFLNDKLIRFAKVVVGN